MTHNKTINLKQSNNPDILRMGQSITYTLNNNEIDTTKLHKLFFTCEDATAPTLKNESGAELLYMLIDDSLNYEHAEKNRYCLDLSCHTHLPYAKRCLKKVVWQPLIYGLYKYESFTEYNDSWSFGINVKADCLKIEKDGYLRIRLERWENKKDTDAHDTTGAPIETHIIDIPEGTYSYRTLKKDVIIPKDETACVIITVEGENYSGNVYFEAPFISDTDGRNMIPEFDRGIIGLKNFAWFGQNLAKREWPEFEISVNDKICFAGEAFLKIHRFSPIEIELPENCFGSDENTITIRYTSDYPDTIPVLLDEVMLLEKDNVPFTLINPHDEYVCDKEVKLLFEIKSSDIDLQFESNDFILTDKTYFDNANLCVLSLNPLKNENNTSFIIKYGDYAKTYTIERCITKIPDNVMAGSGDMIYVDISSIKDVCNYLKWYLANNIGDFVTIRPVYRWGGQRYVNPKVWELFTELCEKLDLHYVHISDGRDIPGVHTNPTQKMLEGKNFMGRQLHERDGQLFYWSPFTGRAHEIGAPLEEFYDLTARLGRECPETIEGAYRPYNIEYRDNEYSYRRNQCKNCDIKEAYEIASDELKFLSNDGFSRHTGPSVMYKYFYENGFSWTGAETMDSSTEILLSFLRGASEAYGKNKYGVHLALQWSTFPHDNLKRYRRYLLSLYVPYLQGVTDINTEEGLWFMEARYAYHNRISEACEKHRKQLQQFNKFIRTHSRTGTFYTPIAFLHGRMDGWNGFLVYNMWGMPALKSGEDAFSWNLLKVFYPLDALDNHGAHKTGYVAPDRDTPFGTFSGTPRGNVDAVPVENADLSKYSLIMFAGYNYATKEDLDRISNAIKNGSTLLCTWAHFTDNTSKADIESYKLNIVSHELTDALSDGTPKFVYDKVSGNDIKVCTNVSNDFKAINLCDNSLPLVCEKSYGKGKIVLVNTIYYPGNDNVYPIYENLVKTLSDETLHREIYRVKCGNDVQYSVYNQDDGSKHFYITAVDWYNDSADFRKAKFIIHDKEYEINIPFGKIIKLVANDEIVAWTENESCEILHIDKTLIKVQGAGNEKIYIAKNGIIKSQTLKFNKNHIIISKI